MLDPLRRLRNAVIEGNVAIIKRILSRFPELWLNTDANHNGWSNLHYASYHGNYLVCVHLITFVNSIGPFEEQYSQVDMITFDDLTVLHLSVINRNTQTLHYLLQEFPGSLWRDFKGGDHKRTPLHFCCIYGFLEGIKLLLEYGANWDARDAEGNTCLHLCFQYGNEDCIQDFLKFLVANSNDKGKALKDIKSFEAIKNFNGFKAVEYAFSFEMVQKYKFFKQELSVFCQELNDSGSAKQNELLDSQPPIYTAQNQSQTSILESKVLSSPIVSMSLQHCASQDAGSSVLKLHVSSKLKEPQDSKTKQNRSHSQSVTAIDGKLESGVKAYDMRQRSNTQAIYRPPNVMYTANPRSESQPHTPVISQVIPKTPSLKSFTISPLVRGHSHSISSPQSVISFTSGYHTSPTLKNSRSKSSTMLSANFLGLHPEKVQSPEFYNILDQDKHTSPSKSNASNLPRTVTNSALPRSTSSLSLRSKKQSDKKKSSQQDFSSIMSSSSASPSPQRKNSSNHNREASLPSLAGKLQNPEASNSRAKVNSISFNSIR